MWVEIGVGGSVAVMVGKKVGGGGQGGGRYGSWNFTGIASFPTQRLTVEALGNKRERKREGKKKVRWGEREIQEGVG